MPWSDGKERTITADPAFIARYYEELQLAANAISQRLQWLGSGVPLHLAKSFSTSLIFGMDRLPATVWCHQRNSCNAGDRSDDNDIVILADAS